MKHIIMYFLLIISILVLMGCQEGAPDQSEISAPVAPDPSSPTASEASSPSDTEVLFSINFNVRVSFGSIRILIDDITDANQNLMSFSEFYALIDSSLSGLTLYSENQSASPIFYGFKTLKELHDVTFNDEVGTIYLQGDIELNTGAFAPNGSYKDFQVFVHDRASIRVVASDQSWTQEKAVAIPYLTLGATQTGNDTVISLTANEAYGEGLLSFLPSFNLSSQGSVNILSATGTTYFEAKNNAINIAPFADGHIASWYVWVSDYTLGTQYITSLFINQHNNNFTIRASKDGGALQAALTLYVMDTNIGTIRYINLRLSGDEGSSEVMVSSIANSGNETTINSGKYGISQGAGLDLLDNEISSGTSLLTNDLLIGQFLEDLEKTNVFQTWKITTLENRPLSASVFGPATSKNPETDRLSDGDILSVLSADWQSIRYYTIHVMDIYPYLDAINDAYDEDGLYVSLSEPELRLALDVESKSVYFQAYQSAGYLEDQMFESYLGVITFIEEVNLVIENNKLLLARINQATNEVDLMDALLGVDTLENINTTLGETYFRAYENDGYLTRDFEAIEAVQAFINEVNAYVEARQDFIDQVHDATDESTLWTALTAADILVDLNPLYQAIYYQAFVDQGYHASERFTSVEAIQGFIDGVNDAMEIIKTLLTPVNQAQDANQLISALNDEALDLKDIHSENVNDYWVAYENQGYSSDKSFMWIDELQAFVDAVNDQVDARLALLSEVNNASTSAELISALTASHLALSNVLPANQEAYWQAYVSEGYQSDQTFRHLEVLQSFVDTVNEMAEDGPPEAPDLTLLNQASNEEDLLSALKALNLDNVIDAKKPMYWMAYQQAGYNNGATFDSIQAAQAFVNQVNSY